MRKRTRYRVVYINGNTKETEKQYTPIKVPTREKRQKKLTNYK